MMLDARPDHSKSLLFALTCTALVTASGCGASVVDSSTTNEPAARSYEDVFPDGPTHFEDTSRPVVVAPWAKPLSASEQDAIVAIEGDRVIFDATGNESLLEYEPMEVVASTRTDAIFLRRVLGVERQGAAVIMRTVDASVTEAVISGRFDLGALPQGDTAPPQAQRHDLRQQQLGGYANGIQFQVRSSSGGIDVQADFPAGDSRAVRAGLAFSNIQAPSFEFAMAPDIQLTGPQRMCANFQWASEATDPDEAEYRQLLWALEWSGNTREDQPDHTGQPRGEYDGIETGTSSMGGISYSPLPYVLIRPEFIEATEDLERYLIANNATDLFSIGGPYLRLRNAASREEILSEYRDKIRNAGSHRRELMQLFEVLQLQRGDLQWLQTAPIVARHACQGEVDDNSSRSAAKINASFDVTARLSVLRTENVAEPDERDGWTKNSTTGMYRWVPGGDRNIFSIDRKVRIFWIGWFPIVISADFRPVILFKAPEIAGEAGFELGPFNVNMEAGYRRNGAGDDAARGCDAPGSGFCGQVEITRENLTLTSKIELAAETEAAFAPEVEVLFYETAGVGANIPVYLNAKATLNNSSRDSTVSTGTAPGTLVGEANLCFETRLGARANVFGRLRNPFAIFTAADGHQGPLAQAQQTLFDSCGMNNPSWLSFVPCVRANARASMQVTSNGVNFDGRGLTSEPIMCTFEQPEFPTLDVWIEWTGEADLDLVGFEPSGDELSYRTNATTANDGNHTSRATCRQDTSAECHAEQLVWGATTRQVVAGDYRVHVENSNGADGGTFTIYARRGDQPVDGIDGRTFTVAATRDARSEELVITID